MNIHRPAGRLVAALLLALPLATPIAASAQPTSGSDRELASLIESLTRRDVEGIGQRALPDGSIELLLDGRFQQLPIARLGDDGEPMVGCVGTLDEAQRFLGRDLRSGKSLDRAASGPAPDDLATRAARHGLTPMQQRFYESLIEKAPAIDAAKAATITIVNGDGAGEGFNDATAAAPEGGNTGTTRGQQRLILFNQAAAIWGAFLDSAVPIAVNAQFNPLTPCTSSGGVLGSAGPNGAFILNGGFAGTGTVFPVALVNKLTRTDNNGASPEINATFNSDVDTGCLGAGTRFYYGLDNATPSGRINLLVVLLHELGHGLGSLSFTGQSGAFAGATPDIWARFQFDRSVGLLWTQMTDAQRAASAINPNNVLWDGANVRIASGFLSTARDSNGRVELFTPNPYQGGSSVSHWNSTASPNLLMEPAINTGLPLNLDLTRQQMRDIGWSRDTNNDGTEDTITNVQPSGGTLQIGANATITWTNGGGFNRNVNIELSTDGGATWPRQIAVDAPNTGSFAWIVTNDPTTQGRIRVREHDFATPAGVSAANILITSNTPPAIFTPNVLTRQQGSPAGAAATFGSTTDAQTPAGSLVVTQVAGGTATGITVAGLTNTNGSLSAAFSASCSATSGTLRFQTSDGQFSATSDLQVDVTANAQPTLSYPAASGEAGSVLVVNPTDFFDNGSIASATLVSQGSYTGTVSVGSTNGLVTLINLGPVGTHTIIVRATDNCGATRDASFQLTVSPPNTPPTFTPAAAITRQQGSPAGAAVAVGTVADGQTAAGSLVVTQIAGGTATGISASGITNTNGAVAAAIAAACGATPGTLRFRASDGSLTGTGDLQVNVTANTAPTLSYAAQSGQLGQARTVNPATGPGDNGTVANIVVQSAGTYTGAVSVNAGTGVVTLGNMGPIGSHTIILRATDNCGATSDATLQLTVAAVNTAPTFTPGPLVNRQQGSRPGPPVTLGTASDAESAAGSLVVTQVAGGTATGITTTGITNTNGTITATMEASCSATSGTVRLQASDGTFTSTGDLQVTVSANTGPDANYGQRNGFLGGSLVVSPVLSDNGTIANAVVTDPGSYTGGIAIGASDGVLTLTNLQPIGTHGISIAITDNCGSTLGTAALIRVDDDLLFRGGFEPAP